MIKDQGKTDQHVGWVTGGILGGLSSLAVIAINYLGNHFAALPRASFTLFEWLARVLPGSVITLFIHSMVVAITGLQLGPTSTVAKQVEQAFSIILFIIIGIIFGILLALAARRTPAAPGRYGIVCGAILSAIFIILLITLGFPDGSPVLSVIWTAFILTGWGWLLGKTIQYVATPAAAPEPEGISRRQFLWIVGAGAVTVLVSAIGISLSPETQQPIPQTGAEPAVTPRPTPPPPNLNTVADAANTSGPAQSPPLPALQARFAPVPGTRPEITANDKFYQVDIDLIPPSLDANTWQLELGGLVNKPLKLSLADLRARPATSQAITLECISNLLGGDLISTAVYTGVPLKDILQEAGVKTGAVEIYMEAADGFYESIPLAEAMDARTLLVYEMNHQPLPAAHGYPLRIYIPNHFGMKQPKWLTKMTVIDHHNSGYWEDRGWSAAAIPPVTSVIDVVDTQNYTPQQGIVPVGGIAYAGARGISKVEVQVDDAPWETAELRDPPLSPLTWVQWRYQWKATPGYHAFSVRATDGDGKLQIAQFSPPEPNGATGINTVSKSVPKS